MDDGRSPGTITIDCATCVARDSDACDGCLVSVMLDRPAGVVRLGSVESDAVGELQAAGLIPLNRYRPAS